MSRFAFALLWFAALAGRAAEPAGAVARWREEVAALGEMTRPPVVHPADGVAADGILQPLYFDGLPWKGKPTRVFAWVGVPERPTGKVPGVVLVHGGGGTAFKEWVRKWNEHGFAAIAVALEGQTDERLPAGPRDSPWRRHAWAGPARQGIYGDSAAPLADQWMYHAVADTVRANSLLRALPGVDADRVGVCGISWGGVITATVAGLDARFAFGIPIYGCGALDVAADHYRRALQDLVVYREVWEPALRLPRARMPLLWLTGPSDGHFPLEAQQRTYLAAAGPRQVAVPLEMKHGHPAGWNPPDSYAFAQAVVATGRPWAHENLQTWRDGVATVEFDVTRRIGAATLVYRRAGAWERAPATMQAAAGRVTVSAVVPPGAGAYFFHLDADGLTLSSELRPETPRAGTTTGIFPGFDWARVPRNLHFGKHAGVLTEAELDFIAQSSRLVALEKSHGAAVHGSTEAGIADTARRLKERNPAMKVLFYFNAFVNWRNYAAHATYRPEWTLRNARGEIVTHPSGTARPDPSQPEFREWWSEIVARAHREAPLDGVFADALPQALTPALGRQVGEAKARAVVAGLREMLALTRRKLGPGRIVLVNGLRATEYRTLLDWEGIDGVMIEHFGAFRSDRPEDMKADLESMALAEAKGKFVILKGWPGFTWQDAPVMALPAAELETRARAALTFPLACFLIGARTGSHFCYSWGYTERYGALRSYPEFERRLGAPRGDPVWRGLAATREFAHAAVTIDLVTRQAQIEWR